MIIRIIYKKKGVNFLYQKLEHACHSLYLSYICLYIFLACLFTSSLVYLHLVACLNINQPVCRKLIAVSMPTIYAHRYALIHELFHFTIPTLDCRFPCIHCNAFWLNFDYSKALWWRVVDVTPIREQNCRTNKSSVPEFPSPTLITYTYNLYFPWKFNPACCKFRSLKRMSVYNNSSHSSLSFPLFLRSLFSFPTRQRPLKRRSLCILRSQGERDGFTRF